MHPYRRSQNNTLAGKARCFFIYGRTINISAPARQMVGCTIEFALSGQRNPQHSICSSENVQSSVVFHFETTKLIV